jgi:sugar lactone lactonase YvrE
MSKIEIAAFSDAYDQLGESPVWSEAEAALYWIDLRAPALRRRVLASGAETHWPPLPELVGSAALRRRGGLVLGLKSGLFGFEPHTGALSRLLAFGEPHEGNRANDARVDRMGRLWCTTMWDFGLHATGSLYRVDADLRFAALRGDLRIPNGLCVSPGGDTLYFCDTPTRRIEAAALDAEGRPGPWRVLAEADDTPGNPDGATVDAEGFIWNARYGGGTLARFAPDGRLDRLVRLPVSQPSSCAFGGPDLGTLFVTTARQKLSPEALAAEPLAGRVLMLDVGVKGLPEPAFAG